MLLLFMYKAEKFNPPVPEMDRDSAYGKRVQLVQQSVELASKAGVATWVSPVSLDQLSFHANECDEIM